MSTFLWWFGTWNKLERWKSSVSGCLMSWLQTKTQFLNPVQQWRATKSGFYTTGDDQLSGWTEKLQSTSKARLAPKEGPGLCSVVYCRPDRLQLSESWWNHSVWEVRSAIGEMHRKWWCLQPALVLREGPILSIRHSPHVAQSGPHSCLIHHIHLHSRQPTITSSIATTSCRENSFTISRRKKMISKGSRNPEAQIFMLWGINKVIFCWQKSVDCTGFYFDW